MKYLVDTFNIKIYRTDQFNCYLGADLALFSKLDN